ncbi:class I adenylate-forming enzyme family protein [Mycobacterium sp. 48b]|uniref:class I adenylate-forming enzyme family protein n=1 Tax=Mycobacterium sp. 48b TaxID=3400426 RepID=UPI003AAA60AA
MTDHQQPPGREFLTALQTVASSHADRPAIVDDEHSWTYAELLEAVERRAQALTAAGVQSGDRVALVAENSGFFLVTAFSVWQVGGVLVTVYPSSPIADLKYCLDNSDPVLVLADAQTVGAVGQAVPAELPVVVIDEQFVVERVRAGRMPNPEGLPAELNLICYSSGTTSHPKAIMLSSAAVFNGADVYARVWRLSTDDKTVVCLPMAWLFGLSTTSMATLLGGGTVIALRRSRPEMIVEALTKHRVTFLAGVTTMFAKLVAYLGPLDEDRPDLTSLRLCISGGEPRNEVAFDQWRDFTGCPVHDTFCATECFPFVTYDPVLDPEPIPGSAGKLVPGSLVRVVDPDGNEVPAGEVGEALTTGPGLMLGYWRDEEQTRAAVTPDGWYRTKDLVRIDADGYVYVTGRLSDMIIRGGSNVSPAEVERVLREHPSVRDVCVVGLPDDTYGQRVAAAVVPASDVFDAEAVTAFAAGQLSTFKIPTSYHVMDQLPLNPRTEKVDRRLVAEQLRTKGAA